MEICFFCTADGDSDGFAKVIDGNSMAKKIRDEIVIEATRMFESIGVVPGLAVFLVGDRKDSATYARIKKKACESVGFRTFEVRLPESEDELLKHISNFNDYPLVHGIHVQFPLPLDMNVHNILNAIEKDVGGIHPKNIAHFAIRGRREPIFLPCTPKGCIKLVRRYDIKIKGKRAVVVEMRDTFGRPAALLLEKEGTTVTIFYSNTKNPEEIAREADIIITSAGKPNLVRGSWIKPGAVIIDVGINHLEDRNAPQGYGLVGDVCYEEACKVAAATTPVAGGVGAMTIAMLLLNALIAAKRIHNFQQ